MRAAARAKSKLGVLRGFAGPRHPRFSRGGNLQTKSQAEPGERRRIPENVSWCHAARAAFQTGSLTPLATARLANPRNLRDNNNLPSLSGRQSGKDSVQLC